MTPQAMAAPPPVPQPKSEVARLAGVFFSPKDTFPDIVARPRWWIPVILFSLVSLVFVNLFSQRVGWEKTIRAQMERSPQMEQATPEQRERSIQIGTKVAGYIGYAAPFGSVVTVLLVAAVFMFLFNNMLGANFRFSSMMGIVAYSFLPTIISGALSILVMYMKDPDDFDIQRPLMFNLGAFMPDGTPKWIVAAGYSFDLFSFWMILLMAIGIHAGARKIATSKAFITILIPWFVIVLLRVMQSVISGS
jgi:hypothetical protein